MKNQDGDDPEDGDEPEGPDKPGILLPDPRSHPEARFNEA